MKIVISGCGKIGKTIVESLVAEGHDILIIEKNPDVIEEITTVCDVMGICGNCADTDILKEANIANADIYIAVSGSDELNVLSCFIAKKMGAKNTVARIRTPEYNETSLEVMKRDLDLSMPINPERLAAQEIFNILKYPYAAKIETFSHRNMELIELYLKEDSVLDGVSLSEMRNKFKAQVLVGCVQRGDEVYIPNGNFVLHGGDRIGITASHAELQRFFRETDIFLKQAKDIMILGGGRISYYLTEMLTSIGTSVKIIDVDEKICEDMSDSFPKAVVINGDGTQQELLLEEGITSTDAFVSLTGIDETNILISLFATMNDVPKVIAKVNRDELVPLAQRLGLECIVSPRKIVADVIIRYARALQNSRGSNIETLYKLMDGKVEALEFNVREDSKVANVPLKELKIRENILMLGIARGRKVITPTGDTEILAGDKVVVITKNQGLSDLADILER